MGVGVIFQVRVTRDSFGAKWRVNTKVDKGRLDLDLRVAQYHNVLDVIYRNTDSLIVS